MTMAGGVLGCARNDFPPYLAGKALMADVQVLAESDDTMALQLDHTGVRSGGRELWSFSAPVAAFTVAVDAEAPLRLIGLRWPPTACSRVTLF
jgi:hypothetical protein